MTPNAIKTLLALGFTDGEARAYCELLRSGPASAYRLAGAIERAPSNLYQTLESLRRKGAVVADESEPRIFRAVGVVELVGALERTFARHKREALADLRGLQAHESDDRFYQLKSLEHVLERARSMLRSPKEIVLFDLFPKPFELLRAPLQEAALRGVRIAGISYGDVPRVPRLQVFTHPWSLVAGVWPGQQVTLVTDARQSLVALLAPDGASVLHAMWTDSAYLSCLQHSGLAHEIDVASRKPERGALITQLGLLAAVPPGLRILSGQANAKHRRTAKRPSRR